MKRDNIFWVSYSDLMTGLFFVMLVLFVASVGYLKYQQKGLQITIERQNKLLQIEEQFKLLEENGHFYYLMECKKYIARDLMGKEIFNPNSTDIKEEFIATTIETGKIIEGFLQKLKSDNPDLSYLLVIEGNMANDWEYSNSKDSRYGYVTSFARALAVYTLWRQNGIDLRQYNTEIMLCGSGFNGLCRDAIEENNKRFSIQIIPKVQNKIKNE